ncbi:MAG: hypothetical protein D6775_09300 [Caldilineae bacterium]|nr:MAG: hypothetical protein D6775_09300 [Caldilineae bacterium]
MPSRTIPVKILGERNTGTHYLEKLLRLNLDVRVLPGSAPRRLRRHFPGNEAVLDLYFRLTAFANLGWKHALAPAPDALRRSRWARRGLVILTLSKNPYAWLLSLYRHPYHYSGPLPSFERFLQSPWRTVRRERCSDVLPDPWPCGI